MSHGLDDVASSSFTLCADHSSALTNASESLAQVAATADEGYGEVVLLDVVSVVGRGENFRLIDVVDANSLENLRVAISLCVHRIDTIEPYLALHEMTNACLGHDGNGDSRHNLLDHLGVGHSGHSTLCADVCWDTLESHDCTGAGLFSYSGLDDE